MIETEQYLCPIESFGDIVVWAANSVLVIASKTQVLELEGHSDTIRTISISPNGEYIVSGGEDKKICVWAKIPDGTWKIDSTYIHSKRIMCVQFDEFGQVFFADKFGEFYALNTPPSSEPPTLMFGHLSAVSSILYKDNILVSADRDEKIRLAKYPRVDIIDSFLFGHKRYVSHMSFTRQNAQLATAGADGQIILWNIENRENPTVVWKKYLGDGTLNTMCVTKDYVYVVRSCDPKHIHTISLNNPDNNQLIETNFDIQSLHEISDTRELVAVDCHTSHLMNVHTSSTHTALSREIPGVPIVLMKAVHHENTLDEENSNFKRKKSDGNKPK